MNLAVTLVTGVAAAFAFALATVLQYRSAGQVPDAQGMRPRQLLAFARATLAHPVFLGGLLADGGGLALHAVALHAGSLSLVQPLLVSGVLFTLPLHHRLRGDRAGRAEMAWAQS